MYIPNLKSRYVADISNFVKSLKPAKSSRYMHCTELVGFTNVFDIQFGFLDYIYLTP